jgi:hypothetical protein
MSLKTGNQGHSVRSETSIALEFISMLNARSTKATCFITGKAFEEEWDTVKSICASPNIETGGHTYNCFMPELWHRGCNKILGSYNGPKWQQNWDIEKTKRIIKRKAGIDITSWRNHMYMHGPHTEELLLKNGINVCCDGVDRSSDDFKQHQSGLLNFPLNIIPDHEHLYHAERTEKWVSTWIKRYNWSDDYGSESYYFEDWFEIFKHEILKREEQGVISHLIIHPITIYLASYSNSLQRVADFLANFDSIFVNELVEQHQRNAIHTNK